MIQLNVSQLKNISGGLVDLETVLRPGDAYNPIDPFTLTGGRPIQAPEFGGGSAPTGNLGSSNPWLGDPSSQGLTGQP